MELALVQIVVSFFTLVLIILDMKMRDEEDKKTAARIIELENELKHLKEKE